MIAHLPPLPVHLCALPVAKAPSNLLKRRGYFGLITTSVPAGLMVQKLLPGGTAALLGIKEGDVITQVNGRGLKTTAELIALAHRISADQKIGVDVTRDKTQLNLSGRVVGRALETEAGLDVIYTQADTGKGRVRVIVTKPRGAGPFPSFFLIGGVGGYSLDGKLSDILYGNILDPIAHAGFVTVRVDKPGQGDSDGPSYDRLTFSEELDGYEATAKMASALPFVDKNRMAIYGHSMGGCFAPLLGQSSKFKSLIANAMIFEPFTEYMLVNARRQSELEDEPQDKIDSDQKCLTASCQYLFGEGLTIEQTKARHPELAPFLKENFGPGETFSGVGIPFFRELSRINLAAAWRKTSSDLLVMYGENDFVSTRSDHDRLVDWVNSLRPGTAKLVILKNTDHAFKETTSILDSYKRRRIPGGKLSSSTPDALVDYLRTELGSK